MGNDIPSISLVELVAGRLGTVEAVTIVREIAIRIMEGSLPGVPSPQIIRLTSAGSIAVEGPIAADARTVVHAAYLLETLLPDPDVRTLDRVPGGLRLIIGRALRTLDLPPYPSLEAFAEALTRFAATDATLCIQALVLSRRMEQAPPEPLPVTINSTDTDAISISDIRRARRATGLTLTDIADRTGIPAPLLCELEWGYLHHWPAPAAARRLLLRYAHATGLDDQIVLRTVWPILEEAIRERDRTAVVDAVPVDDPDDVVVVSEEIVPIVDVDIPALVARYPATSMRKPRRRAIAVAALAIPALLLIGIAPAARGYLSTLRHAATPSSTVTAARTDKLDVPPEDRVQTAAPQQAETESAPIQRIVASEAAYPSAFATVGSATFYSVKTGDRTRNSSGEGASVLRITRVLDDQARNFHTRPSPDGRQVTFDSDRDGLRGVYVADSDGHHVRRVSGEGFAAIPSWSPDGRMIAFVRAEANEPQVWNLWTIDLRSGQQRRVTSYHAGQPWGASWFPDGKQIAYSHEGRLIVMDLSDAGTRIYPAPRTGGVVRTPAVSPDGTRALFQVARDGTWLLDFRTGAMKKVVSDPSADQYTWSPDGRRVAYHSAATDTWGVWIMPSPAAR